MHPEKELFSNRRRRLQSTLKAAAITETGRVFVQYLLMMLDHKVNMLIQSSEEEAVALRGEIRCLKHLLSVMEQGDTPLADSIKTQITETANSPQ